MTLVAVAQLTSGSNLAANGRAAAALVTQAAIKGAKAIFFPEASDYIGGSAAETVALAAPVEASPFLEELRKGIAAANSPITVCVGVHEPAGMRVRNTLLWLDAQGKIVQRYQKVHLFDVDVVGGPILRESQSVEPGTAAPAVFESPVGRVGDGVCYDIRFPEHALYLRSQGAEILQFPSAFTKKTGEAHWHLLSRARAIDTQCYVINAAQAGWHDEAGKRQSYGHTLVVDPWGTVLAEAQTSGPEVVYADIDLASLAKVRNNMPLWQQRPEKDPYI